MAVVSNHSCSLDERFLATTSWDKSINVWDIATGEYRLKGPHMLTAGHEGCASCCKFSNDNTLLVSGGYDTRLCVWDMSMNTPKVILKVKAFFLQFL